jgi:hypothetical protein
MENGLTFNPSRFNIDFEASSILAIRQCFPNAEIKGCLFHYGQSVWRKIQQLGLGASYLDKKNVCSWCRLGVSLALVPEARIDDAFMYMQNTIPTTVSPATATRFLDYLCDNYVDDTDATFSRLVIL